MTSITTPAEIADLLHRAAQVVDVAGVPEHLQVAAFEKAVDLLGGSTRAPASQVNLGAETRSSDVTTHPDEPLAALAHKLRISPGEAAGAFKVHPETSEVELELPRNAFSKAKNAAAKEICLLVVTARHALGFDTDGTAQGVVRNAVADYGCFDQANFSGSIGAMTDVFRFSGKGSSRLIKTTRPAFEQAGELVRRLSEGQQ